MAEFLNEYGFYIFIALIAVLTAIVIVSSARRRRELDRQLAAMNRALEMSNRRAAELAQAMEMRQERLRGTLDERMEELRASNDMRFEQLRHEVSGRLDARLGDSFRTVNEQLARVDKGLGEMRSLAGGVNDLTRIMTNSRARGAWGETQLRALLEDMLAPGQYLENTPVEPGGAERVEFAIVMPDSRGETTLMAVDSKFPVETYLRLAENGTDMAFERRVLDEAKRISTKYIKPPHTVDYAVMFLPAESLYAEVARRRGLVERIQNEFNVLVSGPCTFAALLTSLRLGFRSVTIERRGAEVMALLRSVQDEFVKYADTVARAGQRARQMEDELNSVEVRARAVVRKMRDISED